jgi:TonB family protein
VNAIAWTIVEEISRLTPAQGAVVAVAQGDSITCRASWGSAPGVGARLQPEVGLSGECFRTGLPILCNDAEADPRVPVAVSKRLNLKSILVVPVPGPQAPLGLLEALAGEKNAFSDSDVRILTRLAASLAEVLQSVGLQGQTGTSPVSSAGPKPGAAPVLAPNSAPAAPTSTSAHANGTQPAEAPSVSPAAVKPLTPTAPSASKPPAPAATPSRTPLSATPAGSTAAATKQQPARTAPFPAAGQPKPRQEEQEILPLASSVQAASTASAVKHGSSTRKLEPDGQPIAPGALASGPVPEAKSSTRTLAISGIAALALLAIVAVIWTLSEKQQPQPPAEPAATAAATEPATPAAETSEEQPLTPPALPEKPLSSATQPSTPAASERPRASSPPRPTRSQARESQSEQEQDDIAMYAVGSDIRRPAAVPRVRVAGEGVAPVQPPPAVGAGTASGPTLPSEPAAAPRLAVPPPPTAPQLIQRVEPVRPASARTLSGTVVLSAIIGVDGKPTDIKPVSGHPLLVGAAMNAFRNWRYEPARRNGYPIAAPIQVRFVFTAQ